MSSSKAPVLLYHCSFLDNTLSLIDEFETIYVSGVVLGLGGVTPIASRHVNNIGNMQYQRRHNTTQCEARLVSYCEPTFI